MEKVNTIIEVKTESIPVKPITVSIGFCYLIPGTYRKKYQRFPKEIKPFDFTALEQQGLDVKTWNGHAWVKFGYDYIDGLS